MRRALPILIVLPALAAAAFAAAPERSPIEIREGKQRHRGGIHGAAGDQVTLPRGERIDGDLYIAAGEVDIDGTIDGDLVVSGGKVRIRGRIAEDIAAFSGDVRAQGRVGGDVRAFGGSIEIEGEVAGDVLVFGGSIRLAPEGQVYGTLLAKGADVAVRGTVNGPAELGGGRVEIAGQIRGDAVVHCDELVIDPEARLDGDLHYRTRTEIEVPDGTVAGEVTREAPAEASVVRKVAEGIGNAWRVFRVALSFYFAAVSLIAGTLLWLFFSPFVAGAVDGASDASGLGVAFGVGVVALFVMLVLGVFCIVLLPLALALWSALGALVFLGGLLGKMLLGRFLLLPLLRRQAHPLLGLLLGVLVMLVLEFVPYLGTLAWFLVAVTGMGAALLQVRTGTIVTAPDGDAAPAV